MNPRWRRLLPLIPPHRIAFRWWRKPGSAAGHDVCLLVTYAPGGLVPPHAFKQAAAWRDEGYLVVLIVALDRLEDFRPDSSLDLCAGVLLRKNIGYDFGAWAAAIRLVPDLDQARSVVTANDSIYGPLAGFHDMVEAARASDADVVGLVESYEIQRHFQSFILFFQRAAPSSKAFKAFWRGVRTGDRRWVIDHYELKLMEWMTKGGLKASALFPADPNAPCNPTLTDWRGLVAAGFPFVKAQLLRENPFHADIAGWEAFVAERGFDPVIIHEHLGGR